MFASLVPSMCMKDPTLYKCLSIISLSWLFLWLLSSWPRTLHAWMLQILFALKLCPTTQEFSSTWGSTLVLLLASNPIWIYSLWVCSQQQFVKAVWCRPFYSVCVCVCVRVCVCVEFAANCVLQWWAPWSLQAGDMCVCVCVCVFVWLLFLLLL